MAQSFIKGRAWHYKGSRSLRAFEVVERNVLSFFTFVLDFLFEFKRKKKKELDYKGSRTVCTCLKRL